MAREEESDEGQRQRENETVGSAGSLSVFCGAYAQPEWARIDMRHLSPWYSPAVIEAHNSMTSPNSPATVSELDPSMKFKPAVLAAVRAYARSRPWRGGTLEERRDKIRALYAALAIAYKLPMPRLVFGDNGEGDSGCSCCIPAMGVGILRGRTSSISALHEWAHYVYGPSERQACRWSLNLFRRCFPRSWARLRFEGHMARVDHLFADRRDRRDPLPGRAGAEDAHRQPQGVGRDDHAGELIDSSDRPICQEKTPVCSVGVS